MYIFSINLTICTLSYNPENSKYIHIWNKTSWNCYCCLIPSDCQQDKYEFLGVAFKFLQDLALAYVSYFSFLSTFIHAHTLSIQKTNTGAILILFFSFQNILGSLLSLITFHFYLLQIVGIIKMTCVSKLEVINEGQISYFQFNDILLVLVT